MVYLSSEEILLIHYKLIERFGGRHGTRDLERVKSAAIAPAQAAFGREQYPDVFLKTAVYARNIILDHLFIDGNKRTGMAAAAMFLKRNGFSFVAKKGELEDFAAKVASKKPNIEEIATWFRSHSKKK